MNALPQKLGFTLGEMMTKEELEAFDKVCFAVSLMNMNE